MQWAIQSRIIQPGKHKQKYPALKTALLELIIRALLIPELLIHE